MYLPDEYPANWPNLREIRLGMSRQQVQAILGEPSDTGGTSRKYPAPSIYVYGGAGNSAKGVELWFEQPADGKLIAVWNPATHEYVTGFERT